MLNVISGLVKPTAGRVLFDGVDVTELSTAQRNIAQVFQFPVLYDSMTVEQNVKFPLRNRGVDKADAQRRAEEVAELLEIGHLLKRRAKGLSADAKQLVSLSRALVRQDVTAILFDEPLTVIDPQHKWRLRQVLKRVQAELNHTLVYVTHDQTEALTFADTVVVMNDGEVMQKGTPDELFERPGPHVRRALHRITGNELHSLHGAGRCRRLRRLRPPAASQLDLPASTSRATSSGSVPTTSAARRPNRRWARSDRRRRSRSGHGAPRRPAGRRRRRPARVSPPASTSPASAAGSFSTRPTCTSSATAAGSPGSPPPSRRESPI